MIVLIEGVDGSGKTTLSKQLEDLGYKIINIEQNDEQFTSYMSYAKDDKVYICDRSFLSDLVYRLEDGKHRQGMNMSSMISILEAGAKVIFCHSDTAYIDSMIRGESNITTRDRSSKINNIYNLLHRLLKLFVNVSVTDYCWKKDNILTIIKFIERNGYEPASV